MTGKRGTKTGQKYYSDFERAAGVLLLAVNQKDYKKTADMLGVSDTTIRNWEKESLTKKLEIPIMLELAIRKLLENMPDKWNGNAWAVAFGIMMDKWLLVNGQPTSRSESLFSSVENLPEEEKDAVIREAENIIRNAIAAKPNSGGDPDKDSQA